MNSAWILNPIDRRQLGMWNIIGFADPEEIFPSLNDMVDAPRLPAGNTRR
jgi:hypothetical protein